MGADTTGCGQPDWRVTEGPAIGTEPLFELHEVSLHADFFVTGGMSRRIFSRLVTETPTMVESLGRTLPDIAGALRIYAAASARAYVGWSEGLGLNVELDGNRGVLAIVRDHYEVELHLPPEQFESLVALLPWAPRKANLRIEVERTLDQGLLPSEGFFWNDHLSPVILFNEFELKMF